MVKAPSLSEIERFLQGVEKTAYRMLILTVGEHADALDILQDTMFKLVVKYADRPEAEWKPIFYKIMQNKVRDWQRHQTVRSVVLFWQKNDNQSSHSENWLENHAANQWSPDEHLQNSQRQQMVLRVLQALPDKQRQCLLLRTWEGMSVAETANVMGCSQGSVKTHLFRATAKIKHVLGELE